MIKLYGSYTSPYVRHCRIVLDYFKFDWQFVETDGQASASMSPSQKVPFMKVEETLLTDSMSIVRYLREQKQQSFLESVDQLDNWLLLNTAFDASINVFLLARSGLDVSENIYLQRQKDRIQTCLRVIETWSLPSLDSVYLDDTFIRLACYLEWAAYRQQIDLSGFPRLSSWLEPICASQLFVNSHPSLSS